MTGTGSLVRLALRRDRVVLPLWILFVGLVPAGFVSSFQGLYPTAAGLAGYANLSRHNAGFTVLYGKLRGDTLGDLVAWRSGFIPVVIGVIMVLTVVRHTRTEEEAGRRELVGSTVVGRHAGLAAALVVAGGASLAVGALLALATAGSKLPAAGSVAFGLEYVAAGWLFAAVAAVAAQLTSGSGAARGIGLGAIAAAYLLRVAGDLLGHGWGALSWISPVGLAQRIQPYHGNRWWVAGVAVVVAVLLVAVAGRLAARRDVGAGLLPDRPGPATGGATTRSAFGLAWRLHRGVLLAWVTGGAALGLVFGGVARSVGQMVDGSAALGEAFQRLGGRAAFIDGYLAATMNVTALILSGYAVQAALRMRTEEAAGRAEPVLTTAVGRLRWAAGHLVFALAGPALAVLVAGLAMGLADGLSTGRTGREVPRLLGAAVVQLPAVWVLAGVAVLLVGVLPRLTGLAWGALAVSLGLGLVGGALGLNHWLVDVSPFTHTPKAPASTVPAEPVVVLLAVAAVLLVAGLAGLRRRDVPA
jgi:ABC-2 type transport system permease protein